MSFSESAGLQNRSESRRATKSRGPKKQVRATSFVQRPPQFEVSHSAVRDRRNNGCLRNKTVRPVILSAAKDPL